MANLVGFRFYPTDEEIFNHYLQNMNFGNESLARNVINEIDMSIFDPWEMPSRSKIQSDDDGDEQNVWFFFCHSGWSSKSSRRAKSAAKSGYWKPAERDREIRVDHEVIGTRKTLVFYKGRNPRAEKTSWVVHVYHPSIKPPNKTAYVLCKLKKKGDEKDPVPSSDVNNLANLSLSRGERVVQSEDPVS